MQVHMGVRDQTLLRSLLRQIVLLTLPNVSSDGLRRDRHAISRSHGVTALS